MRRYIPAALAVLFIVFGGCSNPVIDTTPPEIVSVHPKEDATDIRVIDSVIITFSEALDPETVTAGTFFVARDDTLVSGSLSVVNNVAMFKPSTSFAYSRTYTATVTTGITDVAGNQLQADYDWSFITRDDPMLWRLDDGPYLCIQQVAADTSGVYVAGIWGDYPVECFVAKFDIHGSKQWLEVIPTGKQDEIDLTQDIEVSDGRVYVFCYRIIDIPTAEVSSLIECRNAKDGGFIWRTLGGGDIAVGGGRVYMPSGDEIIVLGASTGTRVDSLDIADLGWPTEDTGCTSVAVSQGRVLVGGFTWEDVSGQHAGYGDLFIAAFDEELKLYWVRQYGDSTREKGSTIAAAFEQNIIYLAGQSADWVIEGDGVVVAAYDFDGNFLWANRGIVEGQGGAYEPLRALATDEAGDLYVLTRNPKFLVKVLKDGSVAWLESVPNWPVKFSCIAVFQNTVFLAAGTEQLLRYDAVNGMPIE